MKSRQRMWFRGAVILLAIGFLTVGAMRGERDTVFTKAVNICLECIGIG